MLVCSGFMILQYFDLLKGDHHTSARNAHHGDPASDNEAMEMGVLPDVEQHAENEAQANTPHNRLTTAEVWVIILSHLLLFALLGLAGYLSAHAIFAAERLTEHDHWNAAHFLGSSIFPALEMFAVPPLLLEALVGGIEHVIDHAYLSTV